MADLVPVHLAALIAAELRVHIDEVKPQARLSEDLKADSLDVICLAVAIEDEWGVRLTDTDIEQLPDGTVLDLVAAIEAAQARGTAARAAAA